MVRDMLEYYRKDLHALPLKLQTQLYMHLTCKLIHLSLLRRCIDAGQKAWLESRLREIGDILPGGGISNIHVPQQKVSISTFASECIQRCNSMQ